MDVITLGNHTYHRREVYPYLDRASRSCALTTSCAASPATGACVVERDGVRLGVVNLSGNLYVRAGRTAFTEIDVALQELGEVDHMLVDMHAEATSEKVAMGWHLDGRVTAVVGTHTHVPTADARVLPGGTAYITDVGMTGPRGGVIGVKRELAIEALATQMPVRFETSDEDPWLDGGGDQGTQPRRADSIEQVLMPAPAQAAGLTERAARTASMTRERTTGCRGRTSGRCPAATAISTAAQAAASPIRSARRGRTASASASATARP